MGVEWRLVRDDNKTVFDLGKSFSEIKPFVYSQEELLEYILLNILSCWHEDSFNAIYGFIIRDRILDFVEGSKAKDLHMEGDTWWYLFENPGYWFAGDRYFTDEDFQKYKELFQKTYWDEYKTNPLKFFRENNFSKGRYFEKMNETEKRWQEDNRENNNIIH